MFLLSSAKILENKQSRLFLSLLSLVSLAILLFMLLAIVPFAYECNGIYSDCE